MLTKRCRVCTQEKELSEFSAHPNTRDGRAGICKPCHNEYLRKRYKRKRPLLPRGHKLCPRCKKVLPLDQFAANAARKDGRQSYCNACWPAYVKYANKKPERRFLNVEKVKRLHKKPGWLKRNRLKNEARQYVYLAIRFGDLTPHPCEVCGVSNVQAHHDDYSKPLEVRWLCVTHHNEHHKEEKT